MPAKRPFPANGHHYGTEPDNKSVFGFNTWRCTVCGIERGAFPAPRMPCIYSLTLEVKKRKREYEKQVKEYFEWQLHEQAVEVEQAEEKWGKDIAEKSSGV